MIIGLDKLRDEVPGTLTRHHVLVQTGVARDMLVEAFSNLPNLQTVGLRDYNAAGRVREGEQALWRSFGWSTGLSDVHRAALQASLRPRDLQSYEVPSASVLPLLLYALGRAGSRPQAVEVFLRRRGISDSGLSVLTDHMRPTIEPLLNGLKTLLLSLDDGERTTPGPAHSHLREVLSHTPLLEYLRLNLDYKRSSAHELLSWLGSDGPSSVELKHLITLDLGMLTIDAPILLKVFAKFQPKAISLWKVCLRHEERLDRDKALQVWPQFLQQLRDVVTPPKELAHFLIGWPTQRSWQPQLGHHDPPREIRFVTKSTTDANGVEHYGDAVSTVAYHQQFGDDSRAWLQNLASQVRYHVNKDDTLSAMSDADSDGGDSDELEFDEDSLDELDEEDSENSEFEG